MAAVHPGHGLARAAGFLAVLWCSLASGAAPAPEYQVKAAYLFNFGQFVEWPPEVWTTPNAPFAICVVGDDPFGRTLDDVVRGESVNVATTYGYDSVTMMQETKTTVCQIERA